MPILTYMQYIQQPQQVWTNLVASFVIKGLGDQYAGATEVTTEAAAILRSS